MELSCYKCGKDFDEIKQLFIHLKRDHDLKNSTEKFKCMVKNFECSKTFMNFDSLRQHMKKCLQNRSVPLLVTCDSNSNPIEVCNVLNSVGIKTILHFLDKKTTTNQAS